MKTNTEKPPGYESKPVDYFEQARPEMLQFVPAGCKRVLDVGCGQGNFGELLKKTRPIEVWGIEPVASAATLAATKLDHVIEGILTEDTDLPRGNFDAVVFNDVLEHIFDPAATLRLARTMLKPDGVVIASIPNIRHFPTQWEVLVRGEWRYADSGILDRTHLRFFTRKSIVELFDQCDFTLETIKGINAPLKMNARKWLLYKLINVMTLNAIEDMKFLQFAVVASPSKKAA